MIIAEEEKKLRIGNEAIPYMLLKGRPNRVRISFSQENHLQIETGSGRLGDFERNFLAAKARWILQGYCFRKDAEYKKTRLLTEAERSIPLLGKETDVEFIADARTYFKYHPSGAFRVHAPTRYIRAHKRKLLYFALRKFSELYLAQRTAHWAQQAGLEYKAVRVKDLKSKWGSCSSLGNINLNWQLVLLDEPLVDYVVIHELMHLREMNHSPQFWAWVGKYCPHYKEMRRQLKEQQWLVGILK